MVGLFVIRVTVLDWGHFLLDMNVGVVRVNCQSNTPTVDYSLCQITL